jgi:serine acetyltransferase
VFATLREDFRRNSDLLARIVLAIFRFGQWTAARRTVPRRLATVLYVLLNLTIVRFGLNSDLPRHATVGPGLWLPHPYGLAISRDARVGAGVDMYQRVIVGRRDLSGEPVIGDGVTLGAGALVLGPVTVGDGARIGAGALVLDDVPAGGMALGLRATVRGPDRASA